VAERWKKGEVMGPRAAKKTMLARQVLQELNARRPRLQGRRSWPSMTRLAWPRRTPPRSASDSVEVFPRGRGCSHGVGFPCGEERLSQRRCGVEHHGKWFWYQENEFFPKCVEVRRYG